MCVKIMWFKIFEGGIALVDGCCEPRMLGHQPAHQPGPAGLSLISITMLIRGKNSSALLLKELKELGREDFYRTLTQSGPMGYSNRTKNIAKINI